MLLIKYCQQKQKLFPIIYHTIIILLYHIATTYFQIHDRKSYILVWNSENRDSCNKNPLVLAFLLIYPQSTER